MLTSSVAFCYFSAFHVALNVVYNGFYACSRRISLYELVITTYYTNRHASMEDPEKQSNSQRGREGGVYMPVVLSPLATATFAEPATAITL